MASNGDSDKHVLDAYCGQAHLAEVVEKLYSYLSNERRAQILVVLKQYKDLFIGTLGDLRIELVHLELKEGSKPKHNKSCPLSKITKEILKKQLE